MTCGKHFRSKTASLLLFISCAILAIGFLAGTPLCACVCDEEVTAEKPNIILIMADDVSWECFGCYGTDDYETPNIDTMAKNGIRFAHCYSTPICTTSRVMLMTGKQNFRNYTHFGYLNPAEKTFGNLLQNAGYKTAIAGKWQLNGLANGLPGHDDSSRPQKAGFDESCLWQVTKGKQAGERFWSPPLEINGKFVSAQENKGKYGPDVMCDFLCDFMERNKKEPFFVYYPMVLVHDPFVPTPDTIGDRPKNRANKDTKDKKANFQAMVNYMDKIVGRLVAKTESLGVTENTLIIFTADNGTNRSITSSWKGQSIKGGKGGMTDMGTHVPMVAYWKGTSPAGKVLDDLVDFTDFYPTMAQLAGIETADANNGTLDGRSFLPQLRGEPGNPRQWVLCHYQPYWNKVPGQFARTAKYKLYRDNSRFYEPAVDLNEEHDLNVADEPGERGRVRAMLHEVLDRAPPAPTEKAGRDATDRPIYPDWPK